MPSTTTSRNTFVILLALLLPGLARGQTLCDLNAPTEMFAFDADFAHRFGASVSVDDGVLLIGAPGAADWGPQSGAAYVYRKVNGGWQLHQKLTANDGVPFDRFGASVAVSGDYALIGAPGRDDSGDNAGTVYIFRRLASGVWSQVDRLDAPESVEPEGFGNVLDLDGPQAVISMSNAALAYYRVQDTWHLTGVFVPDGWPQAAEFASSLDVHGNLLIIGAPGQEQGALSDAGAAYIYEFTGSEWAFRVKLGAFFKDAFDWFGASVAIDEDIAVIGTPRDDAPGSSETREDSGAIYVYVRSSPTTWQATYKYRAPDAARRDNFGAALALTPDALIVGAPRRDTSNPSNRHDDAGAAYVYHRGPSHSAIAQATIKPTHPRPRANMGQVIAADAGIALIGAPYDDALCSGQFLCESGAVTVLPGVANCNNNNNVDVCDIQLGLAPDADGDFIIDGCVPCVADATGDGVVNVDDLNRVISNWNAFVSGASQGDVSGNYYVDIDDLNQVLMEWGYSCL